jgi:DNA helicase IV
VRAQDALEVRRLKGDPRMAALLAAALLQRRRPAVDDVVLRARSARCVVRAEEVNDLCASIAARPAPYKAGRLALRSRLVGLARQKLRVAGRLEAEEAWFDRELPSSDSFRDLLDLLWPSISSAALVSELFTSAERLEVVARGIVSEAEWRSLLRAKGKGVGAQAWTGDDLPLLDEAEFLINGRTRTYGHVVVDEAQDLSPMQFRMVARRAPTGSLTVLGDLAQATGAWSYDSWDEIVAHLPTAAPIRHDELTLGYRAPGQILQLASKLLPVAAPTVQPTRSIRQGRREPRLIAVDPAQLLAESLREATGLADEGLLVGLVISAGHLAPVTALVGKRSDVGLLERDGMTKRVTLVEAVAAKGLEFDAVVVVEPAAIAGTDARGLRLLYVAMTRPIQHLSMVYAEPLPPLLVR